MSGTVPSRSSIRIREAENEKKKKALQQMEVLRAASKAAKNKKIETKRTSMRSSRTLAMASSSTIASTSDGSSQLNAKRTPSNSQVTLSKKPNPPRDESPEQMKPAFKKYDVLPDAWIDENWRNGEPNKPSSEILPILHKPEGFVRYVDSDEEEVLILEVDDPDVPATALKRTINALTCRGKNCRDYVQLVHALQFFVMLINDISTNAFKELEQRVEFMVFEMDFKCRSKCLNLDAIFFDTYLFQLFCSMLPNYECQTPAIYTRKVFEMLADSIERNFILGDAADQKENVFKKKTKQEMIEIVLQNNIFLEKYGEKMVIPYTQIDHHISKLLDQIWKESREP